METSVPAGTLTSSTHFRSRVAMLVGSAASNQTGAAVGAHAFAAIGPIGVVAFRQLVAAAVLLPIARPRVRIWTKTQWQPTVMLGVVFLLMNSSLYFSVSRIGLGLAVTLEFLGPLFLALALSRTALDLCCAAGAGVGVWVLVQPGPSSDYLGIASALVAAGCWASYILLNRALGQRLPAMDAPAVASGIASLVTVPVLIVLVIDGRVTLRAFLFAAVAGALCSVLPYVIDLIVLRHIPAGFFGVFMSINPVAAALAGLIVLGQVLTTHHLIGILLIVSANAVMSVPATRRSRGAVIAPV